MNSTTVRTGLVALLVWTTGWGAAQAATIAYVGAETSSANSGAWNVYRGDFRSTGSPKAWNLQVQPEAYGTDGYILFGSTQYTQEADGTQYQGTLYTGTRSGQDFNNPSSSVAQVSIQGAWSGGNTGVLNRWTVFDDGPSMDNPTLGIGATVTDIGTGSLWWRYDAITTKDLFKFTMGNAEPGRTVRVGIQTNRGDNQKTASIALGGISQPSGGTNGYYWPDWYFFDITGWTSGEVLYVTTTSRAGANGASAIGALVFDVPEPASAALLGLAGLAIPRRRKPAAGGRRPMQACHSG